MNYENLSDYYVARFTIPGEEIEKLWEQVDETYFGRGMKESSYYDFPGGVQVIDITRHLTSNAGQVVQYVARSSRLDGNNKGEVLGDLEKARDFLNDEIERVRSAREN